MPVFFISEIIFSCFIPVRLNSFYKLFIFFSYFTLLPSLYQSSSALLTSMIEFQS